MVVSGPHFFGLSEAYPDTINASIKFGSVENYNADMLADTSNNLLGRRNYLAKTYSSASSNTAYTISSWIRWTPEIEEVGRTTSATNSGNGNNSVQANFTGFNIFKAFDNSSANTRSQNWCALYLTCGGQVTTYDSGASSWWDNDDRDWHFEFIAVNNWTTTVVKKAALDWSYDNNWKHIVCRLDTSNGTFNMYINGRDQLFRSDQAVNCPSDSTAIKLGKDVTHQIAGGPLWTGVQIDGGTKKSAGTSPSSFYMADFNFIDGMALPATAFGRYNEYGLWIPIGTDSLDFGDNGVRLEFKDGNNIGNDTSGNNNHYTTDLSLTDIPTDGTVATYVAGINNKSLDSPTNSFCIMHERGHTMKYSNNHSGCQFGTALYTKNGESNVVKQAFSNWSIGKNGKWYFEFFSPALINPSSTALEHLVIGLTKETNFVGQDPQNTGQLTTANTAAGSYGLIKQSTVALYNGSGGNSALNGKRYNAQDNKHIDYAGSFNTPTLEGVNISNIHSETGVIGVNMGYDTVNNRYDMRFNKINTDGTSTHITTPVIDSFMLTDVLEEDIKLRLFVIGAFDYDASNNNWDNSLHFNFGQDSRFNGFKTSGSANAPDEKGRGDFFATPPAGFLAMCSRNLPEPTVGPVAGKTSPEFKIPHHFGITKYIVPTDGAIASGSTLDITGLDSTMKPDFIMLKFLGSGAPEAVTFWDSSRGANKMLSTDEDSIEEDSPAKGYISSFNEGGFTLTGGTSSDDNIYYNSNGSNKYPYVAVCWKANGGVTTNNQASVTGIGTIDSDFQVNSTSGFSIVTFQASSGQNIDVAHGLGKKPSFILMKSRDQQSSQLWGANHQPVLVYHKFMDMGQYKKVGNTETEYFSGHHYSTQIHDDDQYRQGAQMVTSFSSDATEAQKLRVTSLSNQLRGSYWMNSATLVANPSETTFSVATSLGDMSSNKRHIAYCWSEIEGYSKFTGFVDDGAATSLEKFIPLGFRPKFVMVKNIHSPSTNSKYRDWHMLSDETSINLSTSDPFTSGKLKSWVSYPFVQTTANLSDSWTTPTAPIADAMPFDNSANNQGFFPNYQFTSDGIWFRGQQAENAAPNITIVCAWADVPFKYAGGFH